MTSTLKAVRPACSCCSTVGVCDLCHLVHFLRSALKWVIMMDVIPSQHFIIYMLAMFVEFIITSWHCAWSSLVLMAACIHVHLFIHHSTEHKLKFNMAALCVNNQKAAHYTVFLVSKSCFCVSVLFACKNYHRVCFYWLVANSANNNNSYQ